MRKQYKEGRTQHIARAEHHSVFIYSTCGERAPNSEGQPPVEAHLQQSRNLPALRIVWEEGRPARPGVPHACGNVEQLVTRCREKNDDNSNSKSNSSNITVNNNNSCKRIP